MLTASSSPLPHAADEHLDLEDGRWEDVHVITGALKLFFRELPEPLFPFSHFRQFIAAISERLGGGGTGVVGVGPACLGRPLGWTPPPLSPWELSSPPHPIPVPLAEPTFPS